MYSKKSRDKAKYARMTDEEKLIDRVMKEAELNDPDNLVYPKPKPPKTAPQAEQDAYNKRHKHVNNQRVKIKAQIKKEIRAGRSPLLTR